MGPKGKSNAKNAHHKNLSQSGVLSKKVKVESERMSALKAELDLLTNECSQLTAQVVAKQSVKSSLCAKVAELKYQCDQLETRASHLVAIIEAKNSHINQSNNVLSNLDNQLTGLTDKQTETKTAIEGLKAEIKQGCTEKRLLADSVRSVNVELKVAGTEFATVNKKVRRLQGRLNYQRRVLRANDDIGQCNKCGKTSWNVFTFSKRMAMNRQKNPYSDSLSFRTRRDRCCELFKILKLCAGSEKDPALFLLLETLGKYFNKEAIVQALDTSKYQDLKSIKHQVIKSWSKSYYNSADNQTRSVAIMYANDVMSKRKWNSMRKSGSQSEHEGNGVVNVLPYGRLMNFIKSIEMGDVSNLTELDPTIGERVGRFRDLKSYALRLASFYFNVDEGREDDLLIMDAVPKLSTELPKAEGITFKSDITQKETEILDKCLSYKFATFSYAKNASQHANDDSFEAKFIRENYEEILESKLEKPCLKSTVFDMIFGGDGAPAVGTVFLLGFVNVGKRIMSSKEAHLICGADVGEEDAIVAKYLERVKKDFDHLEAGVFIVEGGGRMRPVEFRLGGTSADMKMLCYLAGQLKNSARFFTNFANVFSTDNEHMNADRRFGKHWKPFSYDKMVKDGILAEEYWKKLIESKGVTKLKTLKTKLATFVGEILKGRQVCRPRLGKYVLKAKADPLHIKNNVCFKMFVRFWVLIYGGVDVHNDVSYDDLVDEQPGHVLVRLIQFIKKDMKLNRLSTNMIKWCNETKGNIEKGFVYRFQGEESNALLDKFPNLVDKFLDDMVGLKREHMFQLFSLCLLLRQMISYCARVTDFDHGVLEKMKVAGRRLYLANLRFDRRMSPSLWVLCNITPHHAEDMLESYGLGLGAMSMEPREQKHQVLARYSENTTVQEKWD